MCQSKPRFKKGRMHYVCQPCWRLTSWTPNTVLLQEKKKGRRQNAKKWKRHEQKKLEFTVTSRQRMPGSCILRKWIFLVVWMCARLQSGPVVPTYCLIFFEPLIWHESFHTVIVRISSCEKNGNFIFQIELSYWGQTHQPIMVDVRHRCNIQRPQQWLTISLLVSSSMKHCLTYEMQIEVYKLSCQYI